MDIQNRNKDLTQIFDDRWKATHNYEAVQHQKEQDRKFIDKMFQKKETTSPPPKRNYMEERLKKMQDNINAVKNNKNKF